MDRQAASLATGTAIHAYLQDRGIRQTWVATKLGVSIFWLNRRLRGRRWYYLDAPTVRKIAAVLDVSRATEQEWLTLLESYQQSAA